MSIKNKFPNIKPSLNLDFANTKRLDPRITFTRASTATYWDGVTQAKAEENLLKYSQELDNAAWQKNDGATITPNSTLAPDGTNTADSLNLASGELSRLQQPISATTGTFTFSVWMRVASGSAGIRFGHSITASAFTITDAWQRFTVTADAGGTQANFTIRNEVAGGAKTIFVWGAQLEQRSQVTDYTPTTDQPITKYQPVLQTAASGAPRFDHNPVTGESLGLLIEEQRANLFLQSQQFDDAAWSKINASIAPDVFVAPDGTLSADKIVSASGQVGYVFRGVTTTSGAAYTVSVFAKKGEHRYIQVNGDVSSGRIAANAFFDLQAGVVSANAAGSASISHAGNGWYRCCVSGVASSTSAQPFFRSSTSGTVATNSDSYSGAYIWGAQIEVGAFPTSYIPTTTAQVTRAADAALMTGTNFSSWYRKDEGVLYASASTFGLASSGQGIVTAGDGTLANRQGVYSELDSSRVGGYCVFGGVASADLRVDGAAGVGVFSAAFAYKPNNFAFSVNGSTAQVDVAGTVPVYVDRLEIGRFYQTSQYHLNGHIKRITYYPKRLSNTELQALTA